MPLLVLDPGHGGRDPGAIGRTVSEKEVNLQACLLLREALERCRMRVLMTRESDTERVPGVSTAVDLKARAMLANTNAADLFVSWHYDVSSNPNVQGVAVWIHPSQQDKPAYHKADLIAQAVAASSGQKNRGVYFGDYQVLRDTYMDAVLIEGGFITSAAEESLMTQESFLKAQAEGAAKAICQMFGMPYIQPAKEQQPSRTKAADSVQVRVNGDVMEQYGRLIDGKTYVPVRELAELLGLGLQWDGSTQTVSLNSGGGA